MIIKQIPIDKLVSFLGNRIIGMFGTAQVPYVDNLADVDRVNETTLDWINPSKKNKQELAEKSRARVLLVDESVLPIEGKLLIRVKNPKIALAEVGNHFFIEPIDISIHPTAIIDPAAKIGKNVCIGAYSVIGRVEIGDDCIIDSNVRIYDDTVIGKCCVIKAGAVIGGAGFGYERDVEGNLFRFPQIGRLILGDYVEVGANTCIDRGALSDTMIGNHTKINNLCHIAHNNKIGKNVVITGCVNVSGSNIIEDDVWIAPNASIRGWVHIGKGAIVGLGAVVVKNIPEKEVWIGNPAHKLEKK